MQDGFEGKHERALRIETIEASIRLTFVLFYDANSPHDLKKPSASHRTG
jgi:hypothetical protein